LYCGSRKPFIIRRSSEDVARGEEILFTTRTLVVVTERVRAGMGFLGGESTMDFGFGRGVAFTLLLEATVRGFVRVGAFAILRRADVDLTAFGLLFAFALVFAM
jgi:hypothetical protein